LKEQKTVYDKYYNKKNLLSHFPNKIGFDNITFFASPPSCLPKFECKKQWGYHYQICKFDTSKCFTQDFLMESKYLADSNIIINLTELKRSIFPVEKCNKWFENKYPIPYFEYFDFNLGDNNKVEEIDGETHHNFIYIIPSDLEVYVLEAEAGNFWKVDCYEKRPEELKEWKNGYSKGIAISKKESIIMYWTIVW